jgi:protein-S-isoprenylcysteine O-methyltransferase Ste14
MRCLAPPPGGTILFEVLWIRGLIFTVLVPGVVGFVLLLAVDPRAQRAGGIWDAGWIAIAAGTLIYLWCLLLFLAAGGTPAIHFTRPLRFLIGEPPEGLVHRGLYRFSRNPMYMGVLTAIFGQAILFASPRIAVYGCVVFACFYSIVVLVEEPHLRSTLGRPYEEYCQTVPRWIGVRSWRLRPGSAG